MNEISHRPRRKREPDMDWVLDVPPGCLCHWTAHDGGWYLVAVLDACPVHPLTDPDKGAA